MSHRNSSIARRLFLAGSLILPVACAGEPRPAEAVAPSQAPVSSKASPAAAAPRPDAARLDADVRWLADDAREGRRAGTPGEEASARWLAERLKSLGLEPAGTDGFLQAFEVPLPVRDGGQSVIYATPDMGDEVIVIQDEAAVPLFCSAGASAEGRVVYAGYGISDEDLAWDDYEHCDAKGAVVVITRGTPPDTLLPASEAAPEAAPTSSGAQENPHGAVKATSSGWGGVGSVFHKVIEAKRRGAVAVILAQHPTRGEPMLAFEEGGGAEAKIPALHVSAEAAQYLVDSYADLVARLDRGEKLSSVPTRPCGAKLNADVVREKGTAHNVLGRIRGTSRGRTLVVGAHFDHLGRGGPGSLAPKEQGEIHNGADDNASGTAAVLEIARCLAGGMPPEHDVVVALWSGEELGLLGSEHWARNPTFPLEDVAANLNLDMVGRAGSGKLSVLGAGSAQQFAPWLATTAREAKLQLDVNLGGQGVGGSDHQTFLKREIPALHLFSGLHADYHRPSDDSERFEADGAARVVELSLRLVSAIQSGPTLAWVPPAEEATPSPGGFRTRFGSIPDYVFDGKGMRLDGTSPGGPAEKAGLLRGDVIVGVGDQEVEGLGDFMYVLNSHKPGDVVLVHFLRDGAEETCQVTLESNQVE